MYTRCSADDTHVAPLVVFTSVYTWGHSGAHFFPTSQLLRYTQTGVALQPESASPSDMAWNAADFGVSLRRQLSDGATAAVETWRHQPARENAAHLLKILALVQTSQAGRDLTFPSAILEQRIASPKLPLPTTLSTRYRSISQRHPVSLVPARCSNGWVPINPVKLN